MYCILWNNDKNGDCTYAHKHTASLISFNPLGVGRIFNVEPVSRHRGSQCWAWLSDLHADTGATTAPWAEQHGSHAPQCASPSFLRYTLLPHLKVSPSFCPISNFFPFKTICLYFLIILPLIRCKLFYIFGSKYLEAYDIRKQIWIYSECLAAQY